MKSQFKSLAVFCITFLITATAFAQPSVRREDHFYRKRIVNRIDLNEKINFPLIQREAVYYDEAEFPFKEGIITSLLKGLEEDRYQALHPDDYETPLTFSDVLARMEKFANIYEEDPDLLPELETEGEEGEAWLSEFELFDTEAVEAAALEGGGSSGYNDVMDDLSPYESIIHIIEDRIFDKNKSELVYHMDYIEVVWTDPGESLPEKVLAVFRYEDVADVLEKTQWKNRFNDAEYRSVKEALELRMWNGFVMEISGYGPKTLSEAEFRRNQLLEFEHHLWSY